VVARRGCSCTATSLHLDTSAHTSTGTNIYRLLYLRPVTINHRDHQTCRFTITVSCTLGLMNLCCRFASVRWLTVICNARFSAPLCWQHQLHKSVVPTISIGGRIMHNMVVLFPSKGAVLSLCVCLFFIHLYEQHRFITIIMSTFNFVLFSLSNNYGLIYSLMHLLWEEHHLTKKKSKSYRWV
jgi:hypothetical protein